MECVPRKNGTSGALPAGRVAKPSGTCSIVKLECVDSGGGKLCLSFPAPLPDPGGKSPQPAAQPLSLLSYS